MSAKPDSPLGTAIVLALFLVVLVFCGVIWKQAHTDTVLPSGYDEEQQRFFEQVDKWVKGEGPLPPSPLSPAEQSEMAWEEDQENRPEPKTPEEIDQRWTTSMERYRMRREKSEQEAQRFVPVTDHQKLCDLISREGATD